MRAALTIAFKDFRGLVSTPLFFILAGLCSVIWSFMFLRTLNAFSERSMQFAFQASRQGGGGFEGLSLHNEAFMAHISLVNFLLIFIIPALTMRLFSEEKKMRTYDLLLTSPVSATQIVVGKFLAGMGAGGLLVLISFVYPLSTAFVAEIQWGQLFSSYLGLLLIVWTYVAVGVLASSMTESVMLAVAMAMIFNALLWFVGAAADISDNTMITSAIEHLSLGQHFMSFVKGSVKTTALVFFASVIFLNGFLTQRVVESSRWR